MPGSDGFPGRPPATWDELSPEQRQWFHDTFPWHEDPVPRLRTPSEWLARHTRGGKLLARPRSDPLSAAWSQSMSKHLTK